MPRYAILSLLVLSLWVPAFPARALVVKSLDRALAEAYPAAARFESTGVTLTPSVRKELERALGRRSLDAYAVRIEARDQSGKRLGSAWMDDEIGKHRPITYLVALDMDRKILAVEMLTYREAHGLEARSPRFTRQFKGKGAGSLLQIGRDLDAISGATLSCQTLAFGARKALRQETLYLNAASQAQGPASEKTTHQEKR